VCSRSAAGGRQRRDLRDPLRRRAGARRLIDGLSVVVLVDAERVVQRVRFAAERGEQVPAGGPLVAQPVQQRQRLPGGQPK
jgi:hypothetical protein